MPIKISKRKVFAGAPVPSTPHSSGMQESYDNNSTNSGYTGVIAYDNNTLLKKRDCNEALFSNFRKGIAITPMTYYQEKVKLYFEERPNELDLQINPDMRYLLQYRDPELRMLVPKTDTFCFLLRKGVPIVQPWPYHSMQRSDRVSTRSTSEYCIRENFIYKVNYNINMFAHLPYPLDSFYRITEVVISKITVDGLNRLTGFIHHDCVSDNFKHNFDRHPNLMSKPDKIDASITNSRKINSRDYAKHNIINEIKIKACKIDKLCNPANNGCECIECKVDTYKSYIISNRLTEHSTDFKISQSFPIIIYAPNASGKTTVTSILRSLGIACFEISQLSDIYINLLYTKYCIIFTSTPTDLYLTDNPIAIIPDEQITEKRFQFRKLHRPDLVKKKKDFPINTKIIKSNQMLSDIIYVSKKPVSLASIV